MRSIGDKTDQGPTALSELNAVVDTVRTYGSRGYIADLCTALGHAHAHLNHATEAGRWYIEARAWT